MAKAGSGARRSDRGGRRGPGAGGGAEVVYIVAGLAVMLLLMAIVLGSSGRSRRSRRRPSRRTPLEIPEVPAAKASSPAPSRRPARKPMTEEDHELARKGREEYERGRAVFESAGRPGSPGEQNRLAEARRHLEAANEHFARIEGTPGFDLGELMEECNRTLHQCTDRAVLDVAP